MSKRPRLVRNTQDQPMVDGVDTTPAPEDQPAARAALDLEAKDRGDDADNEAEQGVTRTADGGAIIDLDPKAKKGPRKETKHFENLVDEDGDEDLIGRISTFASDLWEDIEIDINTANKADENYAKALGDSGLTGKAAGGASFPGASTVTHPMLAEVCSDYASRVCRELISPKGPAKPHLEGAPSKEKWDRAQRVARHMNWQTRKQMRNFSAEMEQVFAQEPFSGAAYVKLWKEGKKPKIAFIPKDKVHRPASDDDFYDCERITHEFNLSERQVKARMRKGLYAEFEFGSTTAEPERNKVEAAADKTAGETPAGENVDSTRTFYETSCFTDLEFEDGIERPYILTMDKDTKHVVAFYRNWEEVDEEFTRLDFIYEFGFMPFRGGKPIGLATMLSGIPRAATGALRALLDSALANNFPGGNKLKSGQSGSTTQATPGTWNEVENATQTDDIRKTIIQNDINPTSPVLMTLLTFLVEAGTGMVRTTFDDIVGKGRQDIPVGTMMMLVDEGTVVYSSIFARQHRAMGRVLEGLYRLNGQIVTNAKFSDKEGDDEVTEFDYRDDCVVVPISDPRINSDTQRWTRANFLAQRSADPANQGLYNKYEVEKSLLEAGQIENIDTMLVKPKTPTELAAPNENVAIALGRPVMAFPDQSHLGHLENHADFVMSPMFGQSKAMQPIVIPPMVQHMKEHMVLEYAARTMKIVDAAIEAIVKDQPALMAAFQHAESDDDKMSVIEMMRIKDPKLNAALDKMFAAASNTVLESLQKDFAKIGPMVDQLSAQAAQFAPPPPMDPTQAGIATAKIGAAAATQIAQVKDGTEQKKIQQTAEEAAAQQALDQKKLDQNDQQHRVTVAEKASEMDTRHQMNVEDNDTAMTIAQEEIAAGHRSALSTGTGLGHPS